MDNLNVTEEAGFSHLTNLTVSNSSTKNAFEDGSGVWNQVVQLVFLAVVSTLGTMGNIFVISAVIVIPVLNTKGNSFLVSLAISDLLVTCLVIPASCVSILASANDISSQHYCNFQWQVTVVYFAVTTLTFLSIAVENVVGVTNVVTYDRCCGSKIKIICVVSLTWAVSICFAGIQQMYNFGPDFCCNNFKISVTYHLTLVVVLFGLPLVTSFISFVRAMAHMKRHDAIPIEDQKDPMILFNLPLTDFKLLRSNFIVFSLFVLLSLPLCVLVGMGIAERLPNNLVNGVWCLFLSNGCIHSYAYAATNSYFREAFNKLFYYCCCKTHVSFTRIRRQESRANTDDSQPQALRVHIIQGLNLYAQRKENTSKLGSQNKPMSSMSRSAYEL